MGCIWGSGGDGGGEGEGPFFTLTIISRVKVIKNKTRRKTMMALSRWCYQSVAIAFIDLLRSRSSRSRKEGVNRFRISPVTGWFMTIGVGIFSFVAIEFSNGLGDFLGGWVGVKLGWGEGEFREWSGV